EIVQSPGRSTGALSSYACGQVQPVTTRFTAFGPLPFLSGSTSKLMRWPSFRPFSPACSTAVMCTNTSRPPSSGLIKPYPRSPLKNFTTPVCAIGKLLSPLLRRRPHARRLGWTFTIGESVGHNGLSHSAGPHRRRNVTASLELHTNWGPVERAQRSVAVSQRLRGKPVQPKAGFTRPSENLN